MNKKIIIVSLIVIVIGAGLIGWTVLKGKQTKQVTTSGTPTTQEQSEDITEVDSAVQVVFGWSKTKDNSLALSLAGLGSKYTSVAYEITYETKGTVQGLIDKPMDITGKDTFTKDGIYLGTCSKNVCTPHTGVSKVSLVLKFTATDGKQSQFSKEYDL